MKKHIDHHHRPRATAPGHLDGASLRGIEGGFFSQDRADITGLTTANILRENSGNVSIYHSGNNYSVLGKFMPAGDLGLGPVGAPTQSGLDGAVPSVGGLSSGANQGPPVAPAPNVSKGALA
jgi:hypothetical protein